MTYTVRSSRRADTDAAVIFDWLLERSPVGAQRWLDAFEIATCRLKEEADHCVLAAEADELGIDLRQLTFRTRHGHPYRILFVIRERTVHLAAIRGSGQDVASFDDIELPE